MYLDCPTQNTLRFLLKASLDSDFYQLASTNPAAAFTQLGLTINDIPPNMSGLPNPDELMVMAVEVLRLRLESQTALEEIPDAQIKEIFTNP